MVSLSLELIEIVVKSNTCLLTIGLREVYIIASKRYYLLFLELFLTPHENFGSQIR